MPFITANRNRNNSTIRNISSGTNPNVNRPTPQPVSNIRILADGDAESSTSSRLGFPVMYSVEGYKRDYNGLCVVRWGNSKRLYENSSDKQARINHVEFPNVINPRQSIRNNVNKLLALEKMSSVVNVPEIYRMEVPSGVKAVVRPFSHQAGSGFSIVDGPAEIEWREKFGTLFISCQKEFRCFFAGDKTLVGKRIAMNADHEAQFPCRSKWGYTFLGASECTRLREQTLLAANALGLEIGAMDVLWDDESREYVFLECNTSPTIEGTQITSFYRDGINALVRRKFPNIRI